ncbi:RNA-binding protein [Roseomonas nepalensis]|uniref:RNA-binding protein n=2 Tax=Muricoccus nepalensis TaxID=1854500 RepID=A0A502F0G4_9PROT|nr:RNA-binding protein [Roseomonas nepalensis]
MPGGTDPAPAPAADATPGQPDAEERGPLRRCIVTRESLPKESMIRFVLGPDRALVPDLAGRMPGRGMWLSARGDVLERAISRGAFMKAARGPVHPIPDLRQSIVEGLRRRIRDQVGFARRAGQAVVGFQQAREWLQAGRAALLVEAADGSASERSRLVGGHGVPVVPVLDAAELGALFGRDHAVHVAVAPGRLAEGILAEAARLAGVLDTTPVAPPVRGGNAAPVRGAGGPAIRGGGSRDERRAAARAAREGAPPEGQGPASDGAGKDARGGKGGPRPPGTGPAAAPHGASTARPSGAGQSGRPASGGPDGAAGGKSPRGGHGPAPRKGGRQETRPRRGGEPAVPVTQEQ